jgi:hypothetical protein
MKVKLNKKPTSDTDKARTVRVQARNVIPLARIITEQANHVVVLIFHTISYRLLLSSSSVYRATMNNNAVAVNSETLSTPTISLNGWNHRSHSPFQSAEEVNTRILFRVLWLPPTAQQTGHYKQIWTRMGVALFHATVAASVYATHPQPTKNKGVIIDQVHFHRR